MNERIEYSLSPVVPKEKEFPAETIGGRSYVMEAKKKRFDAGVLSWLCHDH